MNRQVQVHGALFAVALIYGANYSIAKEIMPDYVLPFGLIVLRVVSAVLVFGGLSLFVVKEKIQSKNDWVRIILCGLFGITLNQLSFFSGLNLTSPINASLIQTVSPVVVVLLSSFLLKERIQVFRMVGILLAGLGAMMLISSKAGNAQGSILGDILMLVNAACFGAFLVLVKPLMQRYNPITVVSRVFLVGSVGVIPFGLGQVIKPDYASFPASIWGAIAFVIICMTILAYLLNVWAMKYASPSLVGVYIYLQPVFAILIAVSLGKDAFTFQKALYAAMIFGGVYLVSKPRKPAL
ncbi:DMT family transporter [Rufibacter tibetensis]|uniref:Transmembrane permease n=1 Tax=Rufibacter tibetensis TaxID=512763 RepID=A0A0P0BZY2_9BACT|nr:DMT family transporter [Rufibacter tibetensis]ALI97713.1 transmembrane permease [Rufibacter tibetensis]